MRQLEPVERGWMAGVIDSDGSIILSDRSEKEAYIPELKITNTNDKLLDRVESILPNWQRYEDKRSVDNPNAKVCYHIVVSDYSSLKYIFGQVSEYMVSPKKERANLILEYIQTRQNSSPPRNERGHIIPGSTSIGEREHQIYEEFKNTK